MSSVVFEHFVWIFTLATFCGFVYLDTWRQKGVLMARQRASELEREHVRDAATLPAGRLQSLHARKSSARKGATGVMARRRLGRHDLRVIDGGRHKNKSN